MRIYTLQIHNATDSKKLDDLYHYSSFDNLCVKFKNKVDEFKNVGELVEKKIPRVDENGEAMGGFKCVGDDGVCIMATVYDYDILDDD